MIQGNIYNTNNPKQQLQQFCEQTPFIKGLDYIGVTIAPGDPEFLQIGLKFAKSLQCPIYPLHHIHAHFAMITDYPYIALVGTSKHCELLLVRGFDDIQVMGFTIDMSLGEAYDGLKEVLKVDLDMVQGEGKNEFNIPVALQYHQNCHFSFSGAYYSTLQHVYPAVIKNTAVPLLDPYILKDDAQGIQQLFSAFQQSVKEQILNRLTRAFTLEPRVKRLVFAGGVAENIWLQGEIGKFCKEIGKQLVIPSIKMDHSSMLASCLNG